MKYLCSGEIKYPDGKSMATRMKNLSTALAARSRHGREHAVNAVALIEEDPRDGNSAVSGGHMTDRPKSDGVMDRAVLP